MLTEFDTGEKDENGAAKMSTKLWDANAIEKVDDHTVRLNCTGAAARGAGAFLPLSVRRSCIRARKASSASARSAPAGPTMTEYEVGKKCVVTKKRRLLGPATARSTASSSSTMATIRRRRSAPSHRSRSTASGTSTRRRSPPAEAGRISRSTRSATGQTGVARMQPIARHLEGPARSQGDASGASTPRRCCRSRYLGLGVPGEHHHVCAGASGVLQAAVHEAGHRGRQGAAGGGRRTRTASRRRSGLHQGSGLGVQRRATSWPSSGRRSASTSRSTCFRPPSTGKSGTRPRRRSPSPPGPIVRSA